MERGILQLNYNREGKSVWLTFLLKFVFPALWKETNCCVYRAKWERSPYLYRQKVRGFALATTALILRAVYDTEDTFFLSYAWPLELCSVRQSLRLCLSYTETSRKNPSNGGTMPTLHVAPPLTASEFCVFSELVSRRRRREQRFKVQEIFSVVSVFGDMSARWSVLTGVNEKFLLRKHYGRHIHTYIRLLKLKGGRNLNCV